MATSRSTRIPSSQVLLGTLIVLVGLVLLGQTTGLVDAAVLLDYVPSLFVLLGVYAMVRSGFRNLFGPLIIVLVAGTWQLVALDVVAASDVAQLWPLVIVVFGLSVLLSQLNRPQETTVGSHVSAFALFGGTEKRATGDTFTGADCTALFGGVELDLRDLDPPERPIHVSAVALFGGVDVVVPRDWRVEMDVLPVLGGASDDRPRSETTHEGVDLVVSGFVAFGGVSVSD